MCVYKHMHMHVMLWDIFMTWHTRDTQTAVTFIQHMDASSLTIDKNEFDQQLRTREREWDEGKATEIPIDTLASPSSEEQSTGQKRVGC